MLREIELPSGRLADARPAPVARPLPDIPSWKIAAFRMASVIKAVTEDFGQQIKMYTEVIQRDIRILVESIGGSSDLTERVSAIEDADLPRRVTVLEAKAARKPRAR